MELTNIELARVEATVTEQAVAQLRDLSELQLALVGGGCGEPSLN